MRVAVTGGRDYNSQAVVWAALDGVHAESGITLLISGACHVGGADLLAELWAKDRQVPYMGFPARWKVHGKAAGMIRNQEMLDIAKPHVLLGFPGGVGTKGCISEATKREIPVQTYE